MPRQLKWVVVTWMTDKPRHMERALDRMVELREKGLKHIRYIPSKHPDTRSVVVSNRPLTETQAIQLVESRGKR